MNTEEKQSLLKQYFGETYDHQIGIHKIIVNRDPDETCLLKTFDQLIPEYDEEHGPYFSLSNYKKKKCLMIIPEEELDKVYQENSNNISKEEYQRNFVTQKKQYLEGFLGRIYGMGFEFPKPVQQISIPEIITGSDMLVNFKPGEGKTAAFMIGCLWQFDPNNKDLQHVFISNTHEVAMQTYKQILNLVPLGTKVGFFIGEKKDNSAKGGFINSNNSVRRIPDMINEFLSSQIICATMGKFVDILSKSMKKAGAESYYDILRTVRTFLTDEFDQIVVEKRRPSDWDTGKLIKTVISDLSKNAQRLFFSATTNDAALDSVMEMFREPEYSPSPPLIISLPLGDITVNTVRQFYVPCINIDEKIEILIDILGTVSISQCIIFVNEKDTANRLHSLLERKHFKCGVIHGDLSDNDRKQVHNELTNNHIRYVVSTGVLARGIDVITIDYVINFDMPKELIEYNHRISRSGRKENRGTAISFVLDDEMIKIDEINKYYSKNPLTLLDNMARLN